MKLFAGVAVALLCAGGASPLSAQGNVPVIPARAFAYDTVPARLDSLFAKAARDSVIRVARNGVAVLIFTGPRKHLADSLPVWCRGGCVWEWDELVGGPTNSGETSNTLGTTWGVSAIGAPAAWQLGATGRGVTVTALDSGVDPTHPGYVVAGGYAPLGGTWADDISPCNGHGTHTAGTMADRTGRGVAPDARVLGVKVFQTINGQCQAYTSTQVAGINWAVAQRTAAINISISGTSSFAMIGAVTAAKAAGIPVCRANGNSGTNPPNGTDAEIQTASVNSGLTASGFSNYGSTTDLAAPGESIESTIPGGGYGTKSGTSMAAPHVCGSIALVKSVRPDLSADAIEALLKATAQPLGAVPNDRTGFGLVRPDRAIAALALEGPSVAVAPPVYQTTTTACAAVNGTMPFTATTDAPWLTVWTTADRRVCWTADVSRAPSGTTTLPIYLAALPGQPITGPIISVDPLTRYQTMSGWEATAQAGQAAPGFLAWQSAVLDSAAVLGINRMRMELPSGVENTVDYYGQFRAGTITSAQFNAQRYAWVNDNGDPATTNAAGYQWTKLNETMDQVVVPLRNRLLARGDSLFLSMDYVSFGGSTAQADPNEYAELLLAAFQHLQGRYGFVPDAVEAILEPDNNTIWNGAAIGRAIAAAGARLAAAGFRPEFVSPSVMDMSRAVAYLDAIVAVPGASTYLKEVSYHRYGGVSDANLAAIASRARVLGLRTGMLEHIGSGIDDLLADLTLGNASAWQQYTLAYPTADNGAQYFPIIGGQVTVGTLARQLFPVFQAVRRGAVRIGSTSADYVTAAFLNSDGRAVSVIRTTASGSATIVGLPVGQYSITFTPNSGTPTTSTYYAIGPLPIAFPGAGVTVVRGIP